MAAAATAERWHQWQHSNDGICTRASAAAQRRSQGGRVETPARRWQLVRIGSIAVAAAQWQQGGVSGGRAAAQVGQRQGKGGAEAVAGRWGRWQNNKVGGRAREAKAQGSVSSGSAVAVAGRAAAGRAAAAAAASNTPALDKDVGTLRKDLDANDLSAASKSELGVD